VLLKERSGAAVTDQEFARLRSELGSNWYQDAASMRRAVQRMRETSQRVESMMQGQYGPEVVQQFQANRTAQGGGSGNTARVVDTYRDGDQVYEVVEDENGNRRRRRAR
jgi:hypothetical protein